MFEYEEHVSKEIQRAAKRKIGSVPTEFNNMTVSVFVNKPYTMVCLQANNASYMGFAKTRPGDKFDESVGLSIAAFRAVTTFVNKNK